MSRGLGDVYKRQPVTRVLVLVPTRELGIQVHSVVKQLAQFCSITTCLAVGECRAEGCQPLRCHDVAEDAFAPSSEVDRCRGSLYVIEST